MSPTDVGPVPIVSSRRRRSSRSGTVVSLNQCDPQPNIFNRRRGSYGIRQVTSTYPARLRGSTQILPTYVAVPQISPTAAATPWNIFNQCQDFQSRSRDPSGAVPGTRTCSLEAPFICMTKRLFLVFLWSCGLRTLFNVKITVTSCSYPFCARTPINPKD